jgi:hypothetical protein
VLSYSLVVKEKRSLGLRPIVFGPCTPHGKPGQVRRTWATRPISSRLFPLIMFALAQEEIEVTTLVGLQYGILK